MSRSGYTDDCDNLELYRASVERALKGKRGQNFLREMLAAMDAMPDKALIARELVDADGSCCALGTVFKARGIDTSAIDKYDGEAVGGALGIARAMAYEVEYMNDEGALGNETPTQRFQRMRAWIVRQMKETPHA